MLAPSPTAEDRTTVSCDSAGLADESPAPGIQRVSSVDSGAGRHANTREQQAADTGHCCYTIEQGGGDSLAGKGKKEPGDQQPPAGSLPHPPFGEGPSVGQTNGNCGGPPGCDPSGAGSSVDPFSFFDFPSLNEVKELLPSVLKDISCMEELGQQAELHPPPQRAALGSAPPAMNIIPEPKLINREESRLNLIGHIEHLQALVEQRLDLVEQRLGCLEQPELLSQQPLDCSGIAQAVARLLTDLQSMKTVNAMLPD